MEYRVIESNEHNVWKFVFTLPDAVYESVLYRYPTFETRTVICCSVQSGCPVGCRFCGTGRRFIRNLSSQEIIQQIEIVLKDKNLISGTIRKFQIMFMSMGEPLLNWDEVKQVILELNQRYPNAQLLISTIVPRVPQQLGELIDLSKGIPQVGLQFSIHESRDEARNELIPFPNKLSLYEIAAYGSLWHQETGRFPFLNYCVHEHNNSQKDIQRLASVFNPKIFRLTLSVICEAEKCIPTNRQSDLRRIQTFKRLVEEAGFNVRVFNPAGQDDIGGGCVQLWYVQEWLKEKGKNG